MNAEREEEMRWKGFDEQLDQLKFLLNEAEDMSGPGSSTSLADLANSFGAGILSGDGSSSPGGLARGGVTAIPPDSNVFVTAGGLVDSLRLLRNG